MHSRRNGSGSGCIITTARWEARPSWSTASGAAYWASICLKITASRGTSGIDISDRQVANATRRLAGYNARIERVDALSASIVSNETPTLVVSQAVIQHFESLSYFQAFARQLSLIKAPRVMLQTRLGETRDNQLGETRANQKFNLKDVQFALLLSTSTLLESLPDYKLVWNSTHPAHKSSYAFYGLELLPRPLPTSLVNERFHSDPSNPVLSR